MKSNFFFKTKLGCNPTTVENSQVPIHPSLSFLNLLFCYCEVRITVPIVYFLVLSRRINIIIINLSNWRQ